LADIKQDFQLLERTAENRYRLDVLRSIIDNYEDLASIGDTFNDDRQAHFEPKIKQYQQEIDKAESPEARLVAEQNLSFWERIFNKGLCVIAQSIDDQVGKAYTEFNELVAEPTTPPLTTIPDTTHEKTPRVTGEYKLDQHSSDDDELPPSPSPQPKEQKPKQPELTTTPETTNIMTERFKVPKPRIYTGDNGDQEASAIDAWIQKLKDYLKLSGIQDNENKVLVMQYFLGGTAEEFYHTKRLANKTTTIDFEQFMTDLRDHIVPSTDVNRHWEDWYKIHQVRNGRVDRINTTAIRMEKVAARLGEEILNTVKIQRFLDAMHSELRYAVEPDIPNRLKAVWDDIKKLAERKDAALFQAGRYGRSQPSGQ
jgi:hypothetical protein